MKIKVKCQKIFLKKKDIPSHNEENIDGYIVCIDGQEIIYFTTEETYQHGYRVKILKFDNTHGYFCSMSSFWLTWLRAYWAKFMNLSQNGMKVMIKLHMCQLLADLSESKQASLNSTERCKTG